MFKNIFEYLRLIGEYTNPAKIIFSAITTTVFCFIVTVLLLIFLRKLILIKRSHILLRVLSISYFIVIPVLTVIFGFKLGLVNGIHNDIKAHLPVYTRSLDRVFSKNLTEKFESISFSGNEISNTSIKEKIDTISNEIFLMYEANLKHHMVSKDDDLSSRTASFFWGLLNTRHISFAIKKSITKLIEKTVGVNEDLTSEAMNIRLNELFQSGLLAKILVIQVDHFFNGIKAGVYLIFLLILIIPSTEIGIAFWLNKKYEAQQKRPDL